MKPKVSILVPVYNREHLIDECIQSALGQTFKDFEVIVVDNASEDGTWEICKRLAAEDNRVRVFRNETNIGPVRNWMRCAEEAKGEYCKILFSDDTLAKDFLIKTVPILSDDKIGFVTTSAWIGERPNCAEVKYSNVKYEELVHSDTYLEILASGEGNVPMSPGSAIFRTKDLLRNLLLDIPNNFSYDFNKYGAGPDVLLYALTAIQYDYVNLTKEPLVFFRVHNQSFTIINEGNSVRQGYSLALAWFFRKNKKNNLWRKIVSASWLSEVSKTKKILNLSAYGKKYYGRGGAKETAYLLLVAFLLVSKRIYRAVLRKYDAIITKQ
jgi:glycosyltransferase involved in cell wall biosynthesis